MIYADIDFILALAKKDDWLKKKASKIYKKYKDEIIISSATIIELMLIAKKIDYDPLKLISFALSIGELKDDKPEYYFQACYYQKEYNLNVFDSVHIAKCEGAIISSDKKFKSIPNINLVEL
ncbi:MAG: PIN domain-containing protein [Nanoarchaeota archaeon]